MPDAAFKVTDRAAPARAARPAALAAARQLRDDAAALSPVQTGRLQRGWKLVTGPGGDPAVVNDVPYAIFVEFGTTHQAPQAMMGRALALARQRMARR